LIRQGVIAKEKKPMRRSKKREIQTEGCPDLGELVSRADDPQTFGKKLELRRP